MSMKKLVGGIQGYLLMSKIYSRCTIYFKQIGKGYVTVKTWELLTQHTKQENGPKKLRV